MGAALSSQRWAPGQLISSIDFMIHRRLINLFIILYIFIKKFIVFIESYDTSGLNWSTNLNTITIG